MNRAALMNSYFRTHKIVCNVFQLMLYAIIGTYL